MDEKIGLFLIFCLFGIIVVQPGIWHRVDGSIPVRPQPVQQPDQPDQQPQPDQRFQPAPATAQPVQPQPSATQPKAGDFPPDGSPVPTSPEECPQGTVVRWIQYGDYQSWFCDAP